jgi:hypothetical protein
MKGMPTRSTAILLALGCAAVLGTLAARVAAAHHSDSLYFVDDRAADGGAVRIEGTIARVRWINPHSEFFVDVRSPNGDTVQWAIETDSINQLHAMGWTDETLEVGDKVVVVVSKSKFEDTEGRLRDMLVLGATPHEPATIYLEYKDGKPVFEGALAAYRNYTSCPGTKLFDPERQPGKETLLCATIPAADLAAARAEFGDRVLLLREK